MFLNVPLCENAHADIFTYSPLRNIAVGITAMVGEATDTTAFGSVDELAPEMRTRV